MTGFETVFVIGVILFILFMPHLKNKAKQKEYDDKAASLRQQGYKYDWARYNQIRDEVSSQRINHSMYQSTQAFVNEVNRRCEEEKILNRY